LAVKAFHQSGIKPLRYLFRLLLRFRSCQLTAPGNRVAPRLVVSLWKKIAWAIPFQNKTFLSASFYIVGEATLKPVQGRTNLDGFT
jgi:hypothetical protein